MPADEPPFITDEDDPRHGTTNGYGNLRCRCDRCREAHRIDHWERMQRHPEWQRNHARAQRRLDAAKRGPTDG